jgi:hypothetical protein
MELSLVEQILSVAGALMVLGAYAANLAHRLDRDGVAYAGMNFVGSATLGFVALRSAALGLILIEFAWAVVSLFALARALVRTDGGSR